MQKVISQRSTGLYTRCTRANALPVPGIDIDTYPQDNYISIIYLTQIIIDVKIAIWLCLIYFSVNRKWRVLESPDLNRNAGFSKNSPDYALKNVLAIP